MLKTTLACVVCLLDLFTAFTLFGRFDAMAQQPIQPVPFTPFGDGQDSVLMADLKYQIGNTNYVIIVPAGFVTDFASTPRAIWAVLPPVGQYQLAAVVHDFLYWDQGCTREQADALLWVAMTESRVERAKRDVIWEAVRKFGSTAWADNASAKAAGQPRIIPKADLQIPALVTWKDYRAQLFANGVRPQPAPTSAPDYCLAPSSANLGVPKSRGVDRENAHFRIQVIERQFGQSSPAGSRALRAAYFVPLTSSISPYPSASRASR